MPMLKPARVITETDAGSGRDRFDVTLTAESIEANPNGNQDIPSEHGTSLKAI